MGSFSCYRACPWELRQLLLLICFLGSILLPGHCRAEKALDVVASFFPLAHFAEQVGGTTVRVLSVVPSGAEPHGWEPTPKSIETAWKADLFVYHGAGIDSWAENLATELARGGISTYRMTDYFALKGSEGTEPPPGDGARRPSGALDPHIWLDPVLAAREVELLRDWFTAADPANGPQYAANATAYTAKLRVLDQLFRSGLQRCALSDIIVTHDAFGYLARRYGFSVHAITGSSPEREPSPRALTSLISLGQRKNIRVVFLETSAQPKLARTLALELDAEILTLNPLGTAAPAGADGGTTYLEEMENNLGKLRRALQCQ